MSTSAKVDLEPSDQDRGFFKEVSLYGLRCCKGRSREERQALIKAKQALAQETDIVEVLRILRVFKKFAQTKLAG